MKLHRILVLMGLLFVFIGLWGEAPFEFANLKNLLLHGEANADTLTVLADSLHIGWDEQYRDWLDAVSSTRFDSLRTGINGILRNALERNSLLHIQFDFMVDEIFSENEQLFVNVEQGSVLFPFINQFQMQTRLIIDKPPAKEFNLEISKKPLLYIPQRWNSNVYTFLNNYVTVALDHKNFTLAELADSTSFNRIFFKTDFATFKADLPGGIVYRDGTLHIKMAPTQRFQTDERYWDLLSELNEKLIARGVPAYWLAEHIANREFKIYERVERLFNNMAEHQVSRGERTQEWYMNHFGVEDKIRRGPAFKAEHLAALQAAERRTGIHYELIMAILAIESDYANPRYKGSFYTFPTLVSQYVLLPRRQRFAVNELVALYKFSQKTEKDVYHFIGSYAGAAGWGQFIPSSMQSFFIDANDNFRDVDIYAIDDCIHSIGNYLSKHGLNAGNMDNYQARYNAVLAYNRSDAYVKAVLYMYDKLRELR